MAYLNLLFKDIGGGEFYVTHKTGKTLTIRFIRSPKQGKISIANPKFKLSRHEFVMTVQRFENYKKSGFIRII